MTIYLPIVCVYSCTNKKHTGALVLPDELRYSPLPPMALLLLDADLFKRYNDIYGHLGGDECLRCIAGVIAETIENGVGMAARFGGEEFAVILPGEGIDGAQRVAERICEAVQGMHMPHPGSPAGVQTVSIGVAGLVPQNGQQAMELVTIADRALYRAKDLGRNRVVVA